jgi:hypothetical protein
MNIKAEIARFRLGLIDGSQLPNVAVAMLAAGFDSQAVREVAGMQAPTLRDAGPTFERALAETKLHLVDQAESRRLVVVDTLEAIAGGRVAPRSGAGQMVDLWRDFDLTREYTIFVALVDEWDEYPAHRDETEREIVAQANDLLANTSASAT